MRIPSNLTTRGIGLTCLAIALSSSAFAETKKEEKGEKPAASPAWLALLGDKRLLFSESGRSFLMFGIRKGTWISMGDPIGDANEA